MASLKVLASGKKPTPDFLRELYLVPGKGSGEVLPSDPSIDRLDLGILYRRMVIYVARNDRLILTETYLNIFCAVLPIDVLYCPGPGIGYLSALEP